MLPESKRGIWFQAQRWLNLCWIRSSLYERGIKSRKAQARKPAWSAAMTDTNDSHKQVVPAFGSLSGGSSAVHGVADLWPQGGSSVEIGQYRHLWPERMAISTGSRNLNLVYLSWACCGKVSGAAVGNTLAREVVPPPCWSFWYNTGKRTLINQLVDQIEESEIVGVDIVGA